jgi:hypothetical protein
MLHCHRALIKNCTHSTYNKINMRQTDLQFGLSQMYFIPRDCLVLKSAISTVMCGIMSRFCVAYSGSCRSHRPHFELGQSF